MDVLLEALLDGSSQAERESALRLADEITNQGMSGAMPFSKSLEQRLAMLPKRPAPLADVARYLSGRLSESFLIGLKHWDIAKIQVVSSGFRQLVEPALAAHNFPGNQIHCNSLTLDSEGIITGVEKSNPLAGNDGKSTVVKSLNLPREIVMIGDGFTDYQVAASGEADYFFGYKEFVSRESVLANATEVMHDFNALSTLVSL